MASLEDIAVNQPFKGLGLGMPGSGKTGSLAALANAGFKLRILDFDGNIEPLILYIKPEFRKNVDIVTLEDAMENKGKYVGTKGLPKAFDNMLKMLSRWKYKRADGTEVDLGRSKEWGPDTIVVLDSLTGMGRAAMRRAQVMMNRTPLNTTQQIWGLAMQDQEAVVEIMTANDKMHHTIVLAHMKMVGPKDVLKDDDDVTAQIKGQQADMVDTRWYPSALGRELPQNIAQHFPTVLHFETRFSATGKARRVITAEGTDKLDLKIPAQIEKELPVDTGMLTVFKALGHNPPGTE